jgi:hypothetical protein
MNKVRIDLLFTMSDNLHRVIEDQRDTNSDAWTSVREGKREISIKPIDRHPLQSLH